MRKKTAPKKVVKFEMPKCDKCKTNKNVRMLGPDFLFIPQQNNHNGYNDQFAIGDYQSMLKYSSIIHYLDQYQLQEDFW